MCEQDLRRVTLTAFLKIPLPSLIVMGALLQCGTGFASETRPSEVRRERVRAPAGPSSFTEAPVFDIEKNYMMQRAGYALLGTGLGVIIAGVALIEVDPWGPVGMGGFVGVGVGISFWTAAGFILGFSRPVHGEMPEEKRTLTASIPREGDGLIIGYGATF